MSYQYSNEWKKNHTQSASRVPSIVLVAITCLVSVGIVYSACESIKSSMRRVMLDVSAPETLRAPVPEEFVHLEDYAKASKQFQLTGDWATEAE